MRRGDDTVDSLPDWAVSVIAVTVGISPGLALLMAGPIGRFLRRVLFVRGSRQPIASGVEGSSYERSHRPSSLMGT
jgi:hypothetical protein